MHVLDYRFWHDIKSLVDWRGLDQWQLLHVVAGRNNRIVRKHLLSELEQDLLSFVLPIRQFELIREAELVGLGHQLISHREPLLDGHVTQLLGNRRELFILILVLESLFFVQGFLLKYQILDGVTKSFGITTVQGLLKIVVFRRRGL